MIELAQLFQDMEAAVVTQEPAIENIEDKTENTEVNLNQGNKHRWSRGQGKICKEEEVDLLLDCR